MEELSDKDFDQIFKNRIKEGYLEYEEESWLKMEEKLRKRDRFVWYRNASILLVFLSIGMAIYLMSDSKPTKDKVVAVKKVEKQFKGVSEKSEGTGPDKSLDKTKPNAVTEILITRNVGVLPRVNKLALESTVFNHDPKSETSSNVNAREITPSQNTTVENPTSITQNETILSNNTAQQGLIDIERGKSMGDRLKPKPITLSINVGPDFNSTENTIGGKSGIALGIGVNVPISGKLSVQTGLNYGSKNYEAKGYDYTFNNPNTVNIISGIDASCKVLEIPLRISYIIGENSKNKIDVNAGVSSYIMLRENYRFMYTPASGRQDRFLEEKNENQHYLSVIDLSATYNIKLKNKNFAFGLEPYVKIPLGGIGAGSVPLKSSGISLKLNYELNKKK